MLIHTCIPFRKDKNLGLAYNESIALLPADAWAVFMDHDCMPTTPHWHAQFAEAIAFLPHAVAFVAMANRIGPSWQRVGDRNNNDMVYHRNFGESRRRVRTLLDVTDTKGWGGCMFAVSKRVWKEVGGFVEGAFGCTDHSLHFKLQRAGHKSYLIEGLYTFHVRASSETRGIDMMQVPNCPCRGPEIAPSARLTLP